MRLIGKQFVVKVICENLQVAERGVVRTVNSVRNIDIRLDTCFVIEVFQPFGKDRLASDPSQFVFIIIGLIDRPFWQGLARNR